MGRRRDTPALQAAKGNPRQRGEMSIKARLAEVRRVAQLLAEAPPEDGGKLAPPKFLDHRFPAAMQVWRTLAPKLRETHRLPNQHRLTFALFCVYFAEWVTANEDIARHGYVRVVGTVAGGEMERLRPVVRMREIAFANVMDLSKNFGLTPTDEYALFAHQRIAAQANPGLFEGGAHDRPQAAPDLADDDDDEAQPRSMVGDLASLDGRPPRTRPN